jgi:hypothetical protein
MGASCSNGRAAMSASRAVQQELLAVSSICVDVYICITQTALSASYPQQLLAIMKLRLAN